MEKVIVLFEVTIKDDKQNAYLAQAATLGESLAQAEGFLGSERFSSLAVPEKIMSKSEWRDEDCVTKWRNQAKHRMSQQYGRMEAFVDYKITVVTPVRSYSMTNREEAPDDSNTYFDKL